MYIRENHRFRVDKLQGFIIIIVSCWRINIDIEQIKLVLGLIRRRRLRTLNEYKDLSRRPLLIFIVQRVFFIILLFLVFPQLPARPPRVICVVLHTACVYVCTRT